MSESDGTFTPAQAEAVHVLAAALEQFQAALAGCVAAGLAPAQALAAAGVAVPPWAAPLANAALAPQPVPPA
jgi:hypothetical protein